MARLAESTATGRGASPRKARNSAGLKNTTLDKGGSAYEAAVEAVVASAAAASNLIL